MYYTNEEYIKAKQKVDASVYAQKPFNLKILKQDVDKYLDSDVDIQRAKHKVEYRLQTTTDFLDRNY